MMLRRDVRRAGAAAGIAGLAGCVVPGDDADFTESFEDGLGDWKTDRPSGLADGWHEYEFEWTTPELSTDTLYLAVGTAVIWEDDAAHYVDDLSVGIEPR